MKEEKLQKTLASEEKILSSTISTTSSSYSVPTPQPTRSAVVSSTPAPVENDVGVPAYYDKSRVITAEIKEKKVVQNQNPEQFNLLASTLFSASTGNEIDSDPYASPSPVKSSKEEEVLRLPNRSVTVNKSKKEKGSVTFNEPAPVIPPTPVSAGF